MADEVVVTLRMKQAGVEWLDRLAQDRETSRAALIREALREYRANWDRRNPQVNQVPKK